jgi:hypothetical protein
MFLNAALLLHFFTACGDERLSAAQKGAHCLLAAGCQRHLQQERRIAV